MSQIAAFSFHLRRSVSRFFALMARKWQDSFYLYLAIVFTALIVVDTAYFHKTTDMKQAAFDLMVRYRLIVPPADKDIVIVDINEASLAAMASEYGRWPWPRQVLAEFVEHLQQQQPKAIVFDILFSDADVFNPDSDKYFNDAIAQTNNTFFPMLRLDASYDSKSEVKPNMIPGVIPLGEDAQADATIAVVLPHFQAAMEGGRLGFHNIYPDADGIARAYDVYRNDYGWLMPSLPYRIAQKLDFPAVDRQHVLLNWRGGAFSYHSVSFSDVFNDFASKTKTRPANEFTGKIVIIGSTAPSLFDIKPTPVSQMHPGVEILATAIDNLKHGDYLRIPDAKLWNVSLTLLIIWITAWAFYRDTGRDKIDRLFGLSQFLLLAISYASINFTTTYINLTGPVTTGLAFFTIARIYASGTSSALERSSVRSAQERSGEFFGILMLVRLGGRTNVMSDSLLNDAAREHIRQVVEKTGDTVKSVEILKGSQKGLWKLFDDTLAISWLIAKDDVDTQTKIKQDIDLIQRAIMPLLAKYHLTTRGQVEYCVHEGFIAGGEQASDSWRSLFAETWLTWQKREQNAKQIS